MIQKVKHATLWSFTALAVLIVGILLFFKLGPTVERWVSPLFTDVTANFIVFKPDYTDILVSGVKSRNCLLTAAKVDASIEGTIVNAQSKMLTQDGYELTVEQQRTSVGDPFIRIVRVTPASSHVKITVYSRCHPLWLSSQEMFELDVTKYPAQVR